LITSREQANDARVRERQKEEGGGEGRGQRPPAYREIQTQGEARNRKKINIARQ